MPKFEVVSLDVWGNEKDGYEVNDAFHTGIIVELDEQASDKAIIRALIDAEYLVTTANRMKWNIDGDPEYTLYVERASSKCTKPICQLARVKE